MSIAIPTRVLVMGSSGSGTTTLGRAVAERLGIAFFDADDYYWLPTDPPFRQKRDESSRFDMMSTDLGRASSAVVAGSIMNWGRELEDSFSLIVFLILDAAIRIERLRIRELALLGRIDEAFLEWAAQYEEGRLPGRNRARHEKWLRERSCPVLRLDGDLSVNERLERVIETLATNTS